MYRYFIKTPWIVKKLFPDYVWDIPSTDKDVYLSFDDGPHPEITPWVLNELRNYDAFASFFCIGQNVKRFPEVYKAIIDSGHAVGNHTQHHLNGWQTTSQAYWKDIEEAASLIDSSLFRPPYGRIKSRQAKGLCDAIGRKDAKIIMWDVLSADFDQSLKTRQCVDNVLNNVVPGSIVVFHDSEKAYNHLKISLPIVLKKLNEEGYRFKKINM